MAIELKTLPKRIPASKLRDWQIARIVKWRIQSYVGRIVFRQGDGPMNLDINKNAAGECWPGFFRTRHNGIDDDFLVEVLPNGAKAELVIENNQ